MNKYCFYCEKKVITKIVEENEDFDRRQEAFKKGNK